MKGNACLDEPKETELQDILSRMRSLNSELDAVANRASYVRGRLEGGGTCKETSDESPARAGLIGSLRDALDFYTATLEGLHKDVSRLEEIA